jgi:hypothetical protein
MDQQKLTTLIQRRERRERRQRRERFVATVSACCRSQGIPTALLIQSVKELKGSLKPAHKGRAGANTKQILALQIDHQAKRVISTTELNTLLCLHP